MKLKKKLNFLKASPRELRLLLECTQEELASFLNVHQTAVALAESGSRNLSQSAMVHFRALMQWLSDAYIKVSNHRPDRKLDRKDELYLKSLLTEREMELLAYRKKLLLMESLYEDSMNLLDVLTNIEITTVGALRKRHERWLQALIAHQYVRQRKFGLKEQVMLRAKVEGIRRELEVLKEAV